MKYLFVSVFFVSSLLSTPGISATTETAARVQREEGQIFFDIDQLQEEMIENKVIETLDTRPPLPPRVMVWLRIIGLPLMNAFVAVRKVVRDTWHRIVAATIVRFKNKKHASNKTN